MFKRFTKGNNISESDSFDIGAQALAFVAAQGLEPTPLHYEIGYIYVAASDSLAARAVDAILVSGETVSSEHAAYIVAAHHAISASPHVDDEEDHHCIRLRHQTLHLAELAAHAVATTGQFGRDLTDELAGLGRDGPAVATVVSAMIQRTGDAERRLAAAGEQIETLRSEVAAARGDSHKDALTGLGNRRAIKAKVEGTGCSRTAILAVCDIDRFKGINDRHGHSVGDRVLKAVAGVIQEECAPHLVARWGGEEFVVLIEGLNVPEAAELMERVNLRLSAKAFRVRETDKPVGRITLSVGITDLRSRSFDEAVADADSLMYQAKRAGRNRVIAEVTPPMTA